MTRTRLAGLTAALVSVAALTASSLIATSTADARPAGDARASAAIQFTAVSIKDDGTLGMSSMFAPGLRTFKVTATKPGQEFFILKLKAGNTLEKLSSDVNAAFGANDLAALNRFYDGMVAMIGIIGGPNHAGFGRVKLSAGTYWAMANPAEGAWSVDRFKKLTVTGEASTATTTYTASILAASDTAWGPNPASIPTQGWLRFRNSAQSPHFIELDKLAAGKTYADFKKWIRDLHHGIEGPPPFGKVSKIEGLVSPGRSYAFKYDLPPGLYVVSCWMPDRQSGMPHAMMGMHRALRIQ